ncbi:hypothetical protein [Solimicrobium silvestre]|uniref:Uncharacterized protein n=1 Tax=Solimicrobium silvestre TaxID=2099400 RepID=A0A2S9H3J3_9BURK|nr:hypothetical protein [Solimicrobium silvestre]PRC94554.1 hypothetical protein S2091_0557 [Solimicrobium silvestre]
MMQTISKMQAEDEENLLLAKARARANYLDHLKLQMPKWNAKALCIELAIIVVCYACVAIYNWLFNASIPPVLGIITGAVNGCLVAWCITRTEPKSKKDKR